MKPARASATHSTRQPLRLTPLRERAARLAVDLILKSRNAHYRAENSAFGELEEILLNIEGWRTGPPTALACWSIESSWVLPSREPRLEGRPPGNW